MTVSIIAHPDCLLHFAGASHPERSDRVKVVQQALTNYQFISPVSFHEAPLATLEQLKRVHAPDYVDWLSSIAPTEGILMIDEDTYMNPYSWNAALRSAGAAILAVDLVMQKKSRSAFCDVRPPGHHAEYDRAMGFCFFNNVAVGVAHAMEQYQIERAAIIDFDVHHGNGTQNIFQYNSRVLLCSSFEHPFYPGYDETMDNEHILNVPLVAGTTGIEYRERVQAAWFDKIAAFAPQIIFFSAGFDAHERDPIGELKLTVNDYIWITKQIAAMAKKHCEGRMVSLLEGGYNLEALAECVPAHVNAMMD